MEAIVDKLLEDNEFFVQFYVNFQRPHNKYGVVKSKTNSDGTMSYSSIIINATENTNPLIESWKAVLENKIILSPEDSVYNSDGTINMDNVDNNINTLITFTNDWVKVLNNLPTSDGNTYTKQEFIEAYTETIGDQLKALGIVIENDDLKMILSDVNTEVKDQKSFRHNSLVLTLLNLNQWVKKNNPKEIFDIYEKNKGNYGQIARIMVLSIEDSIEGAVTQGGKTYWSYLKPNAITRLIKNLQNPTEEFIEEEFRQYDGTIYNSKDGTYNIH